MGRVRCGASFSLSSCSLYFEWEGLTRKSSAPKSNAATVLSTVRGECPLKTITRARFPLSFKRSRVWRPSMSGILMSRRTRSTSRFSSFSRASRPLPATPTTFEQGKDSIQRITTRRKTDESSTTRTLNLESVMERNSRRDPSTRPPNSPVLGQLPTETWSALRCHARPELRTGPGTMCYTTTILLVRPSCGY